MQGSKSSFLDKALGRIERLDAEGIQTVVQRLAREREFLETLFHIIEDGVLVVDPGGRIAYYNRAVTDLLGLPEETAEGERIHKFLPGLNWSQMARDDREGGERVVRHEFEVSYPKHRFLRLYAAPLDGDAEGESGWALVLNDATEARQQTFDAIESERVQTLTLLAASVAHEIGNPLNALHIHMQLMEREIRKLRRTSAAAEADETAGDNTDIVNRMEKYLHVAKGEITRLDYIVTQFLKALRPSPPDLKPDSLNKVAEEALQLLGPEIEDRGVAVKTKLRKRLPDAHIDAGQIKQALVNLIKNAIQAMTTGGELTLQTGSAKEGVWITVNDTGGGIDEEKIKRIFDPYFTTKKKGSGLGLMIVHRIVRDHGGLIDVSSHTGSGATFRIWLPLRERTPRMIPVETEADASQSQT